MVNHSLYQSFVANQFAQLNNISSSKTYIIRLSYHQWYGRSVIYRTIHHTQTLLRPSFGSFRFFNQFNLPLG